MKTDNAFDPSKFVHSAKDTYDLKKKYDSFLEENAHLCAPFHVSGLEEILPMQYPGQLAVHYAKSHHGKSTGLRNVIFKAQQRVEDTDSMVAIISLEDTAETTASKFVRRYDNKFSEYQDDQLIFIGNSFGMSSSELSQLNIEHIIECLHYGLKQRTNIKRYSHIILDYIQIIPESEDALSKERRDQATHNTKILYGLSREFTCPVDFASQALLKGSYSHYGGGKMRIPGAGDLKEAGELYEIPNIAIAYWMPKRETDTPVGAKIEDGNWYFQVESNLIFIKVEKWRDCELQNDKNGNPYDVVGRTFPCWIKPDGEIVYDKDKHHKMAMTPVSEKEL